MGGSDMGWKNVAAGLGTSATVNALKAAREQVSGRQYKRLISTAVAQLLELHPDIGPRKARRRARRLTGAKPSRKLMRAADNLGWKEGAEAAVAVAATAGAVKVGGIVGSKLKEKFGSDGDERDAAESNATEAHAGSDSFTREAADIRH
jgi:hypothetical protein